MEGFGEAGRHLGASPKSRFGWFFGEAEQNHTKGREELAPRAPQR
jgi:hypothetical protein